MTKEKESLGASVPEVDAAVVSIGTAASASSFAIMGFFRTAGTGAADCDRDFGVLDTWEVGCCFRGGMTTTKFEGDSAMPLEETLASS